MKIYLATWTEANQKVSLDEAKVEKRLLSYHFIKEEKHFLKKYKEVKNGKRVDTERT